MGKTPNTYGLYCTYVCIEAIIVCCRYNQNLGVTPHDFDVVKDKMHSLVVIVTVVILVNKSCLQMHPANMHVLQKEPKDLLLENIYIKFLEGIQTPR